jgi:hypothetical protein
MCGAWCIMGFTIACHEYIGFGCHECVRECVMGLLSVWCLVYNGTSKSVSRVRWIRVS